MVESEDGFLQVEFNKEPLQRRCEHTVQFLQDVELMTHADYFVGALAILWTTTVARHLLCYMPPSGLFNAWDM
jgi:hypothetical protein